MNISSLQSNIDTICERTIPILHKSARTLIGIAGPPASGKSTLAEGVLHALCRTEELSVSAVTLLAMDGYHLDNRVLVSRGLLAKKGAPETFDSYGFCDAVKNLADMKRESFHPVFDRRKDIAIANAIGIDANVRVVIVEGNYLLLTTKPWSSLYDVFALTVCLSPPMPVIMNRLRQRWLDYGLDDGATTQRVISNDLPNAELVLHQSRKADIVLS